MKLFVRCYLSCTFFVIMATLHIHLYSVTSFLYLLHISTLYTITHGLLLHSYRKVLHFLSFFVMIDWEVTDLTTDGFIYCKGRICYCRIILCLLVYRNIFICLQWWLYRACINSTCIKHLFTVHIASSSYMYSNWLLYWLFYHRGPWLAERICLAAPICAGVVFFFVLANFTMATFMDPGVLPRGKGSICVISATNWSCLKKLKPEKQDCANILSTSKDWQ